MPDEKQIRKRQPCNECREYREELSQQQEYPRNDDYSGGKSGQQ